MVLYFTGTGNSKYIAERIATALNEDILSMNDRIKEGNTANVMTGKSMVIVVPTYAWRIPRVVLNWLQQTKFPEAKKIWFVMDCGGEIGNAAKYNQELSRQLHLSYMGTAQIVMPENYIAMFGVPGKAEAKEIVAKAEPSIDDVIKDIQAKREFSKPRNNMYDNYEQCGKYYFLSNVCKSRQVYGYGCLYKLWQMRTGLSVKQCSVEKWKTCMGFKLYALYGMYLLLPGRSNRIWKEKRRKTTIYF